MKHCGALLDLCLTDKSTFVDVTLTQNIVNFLCLLTRIKGKRK